MDRFKSIYPFTTENIAGYMNDLDLTGKRVVTVTGSGDHVINVIDQGAREVVTFDVNPLCKYYLDLKLACLRELSYGDFLEFLLRTGKNSLNYDVFKKLYLEEKSRDFFERKYYEVDYDGEILRNGSLFINKYFNGDSKLWENIYLDKNKYYEVREKMDDSSIKFICSNLKDLKLDGEFDYMFLSNIADYLELMFDDNYLERFRLLLDSFNVNDIYFAYLYDVFNGRPRSIIDDVSEVSKVFENLVIKTFRTALESAQSDTRDAVLIMRRKYDERRI